MLKKLKIWQSLSLIILPLLIPFFFGINLLVEEKDIAIEFGEKERIGVATLQPVRRLLRSFLEYPRLAAALRAGDPHVEARLKVLRAQIDGDLAELAALDRQHGSSLRTGGAVSALRAEWHLLQQAVTRHEVTGDPAFHAINGLLALNATIGNYSNLMLDPDLDTFYLMESVIEKLPNSLHLTDQAFELARGVLRGAAESQTPVLIKTALLRANLRALDDNYRVAIEANAALDGRLAPLRHRHLKATTVFSSMLEQQLLQPQTSLSAADLAMAYGETIRATFELYEATASALDHLLEQRVKRLRQGKVLALGTSLAVLLMTVVLTLAIIRSLTTPLNDAVRMAEDLAQGNLDVHLDRDSPNEIGQLIAAMNTMAIALRESQELNQRQIDALKQIDKLKDDFLNIVSHELKTPLTIIFTSGKLLQGGTVGPLNEKQLQHLNKMLKGGQILSGLITDLLDMSQIQAGQLGIIPRAFHPRKLLDDLVDSLTPLAEAHHHRLSKQAPDGLPLIEADEQRVGQVLINLINNAITYTPDGGSIRVEASLEDDRLMFQVSDTGIGIPPEDLENVFVRFVRLDSQHVRKTKGTGLGLSISQAIVQAHGGELGVRSKLGEGSTFWFSLPLRPERLVEK